MEPSTSPRGKVSGVQGGARLLVVDDLTTNLQVIENLLAPYQVTVDTCLNGLQAIELVKRGEYDIVFMDHVMPEMDGVETTEVIRSLEGERFRTVPIIALTANAAAGMRETFIEKGFNDFLAKPIDISRLDEILDRWIPKEKKEKARKDKEEKTGKREERTAPAPHVFEIELRRLDKLNHYRAAFRMSRTSSGLEFDSEYYRRFASIVESFDTLPGYLQEYRALLIEAGRNEDPQKINELLPCFYEGIAAMYREKANNEKTENRITGEILQRLKEAIQGGDNNTAGKIITELGAKNLNPAERELYFRLYDSLMDDNTKKALETIDRYEVS